MPDPIAEMQVVISVKDLDKLFAASEAIQGRLAGIEKAAGTIGMAVSNSFGTAVRFVEGFVRQGLAASAMGDYLNYQMSELARQVGSVFVPVFQAASEKLQQVINWFRNLTGEEQAQLRFWGMVSFGVLTASAALPKVIAAFSGLDTAIRGIGTAMGVLAAHPLVAIGVAIAAAVTASGRWKEIIESIGNAAGRIADKFKDSGLAQSFEKIFKSIGRVLEPVIDVLVRAIGLFADTFLIVIDVLDPFIRALEIAIEGVAIIVEKASSLINKGGSSTSAVLAGGAAGAAIGSVIPGLGTVLGGAIGAVMGLLVPADVENEQRARRQRTPQARNELTPHAGGFMSLQAAYERLTLASLRASGALGKTPQEESRDWLQKIWELLSNAFGKAIPPMGGANA